MHIQEPHLQLDREITDIAAMVESRFEVQTWTEGLLLSHVLAGFAAAYCYYIVTRLPLGLSRLVSCIPVIVLYAWLPLIFNRSTHVVGVCSLYCILTWLATFKLLLLCWGQGPGSEPLSFPRFAIVMVYPAHVTRMGKVVKRVQYDDHSSSWWEQVSKSEVWYMLVFRSLLKLTVLAVLLNVLSRHNELPGTIHHLLLSLQLFLFATIVLELLAAIASALFGVTIEPHFDNPFAARSLGEFWGRRWNLLVSNCLRETVYSPLLSLLGSSSDDARSPEGCLPQENKHRETVLGLRQRSRLASSESSEVVNPENLDRRRSHAFGLPKLVATMASFLVSGLCHELLVYYATLEVTWEMMSFFVVQGVAVSFEGLLKLHYPERRPPRALATIWTLGFAFLSAHWLFWPPLDSTQEQMTWEMRNLLPF